MSSLATVARLRGGVELVASDNVRLESSADGRVYSLIIVKVGVSDEGEYTVRATTESAQISSAANILIQRTLLLAAIQGGLKYVLC